MTASGDRRIDESLRTAAGLVQAARALTIALEDFPAIDLPPSSGTAIDQAQLRAIAVLYLASELETAGVIPAAEDLVRLARTGSLPIDVGEATPLLDVFWRERNERASADERRSFFAALFGGAGAVAPAGGVPNELFEDRLLNLCEALYKLDELASNPSWGGVAQQARIRGAAEQLLRNLAQTAGGLTVFLAQEILATIRQALAILNHRAVAAAFGARSVSDVVRGLQRRLRQPLSSSFDVHTRRGQAGMTVLAWLAEAAPLLAARREPLVAIDHPVIPAAVEWLEASLTLTESPISPPSPHDGDGRARPHPGNDVSGWATIGA